MKRLIIAAKASDGMTIGEAVTAANQLACDSCCLVELTFNCTKIVVASGIPRQTLEKEISILNNPHPEFQYIEGDLK